MTGLGKIWLQCHLAGSYVWPLSLLHALAVWYAKATGLDKKIEEVVQKIFQSPNFHFPTEKEFPTWRLTVQCFPVLGGIWLLWQDIFKKDEEPVSKPSYEPVPRPPFSFNKRTLSQADIEKMRRKQKKVEEEDNEFLSSSSSTASEGEDEKSFLGSNLDGNVSSAGSSSPTSPYQVRSPRTPPSQANVVVDLSVPPFNFDSGFEFSEDSKGPSRQTPFLRRDLKRRRVDPDQVSGISEEGSSGTIASTQSFTVSQSEQMQIVQNEDEALLAIIRLLIDPDKVSPFEKALDQQIKSQNDYQEFNDIDNHDTERRAGILRKALQAIHNADPNVFSTIESIVIDSDKQDHDGYFTRFKVLPPELLLFDCLKKIEIRTQPLTHFLPTSSFKQLETLVIENTFLESLPDDIGSLKNLKELQIKKSKLTEVPPSFKELRLAYLDLSGNSELSSIPVFTQEFPSFVNLAGCALDFKLRDEANGQEYLISQKETLPKKAKNVNFVIS